MSSEEQAMNISGKHNTNGTVERQIIALQQRLAALEHELAQRKQVEAELRHAHEVLAQHVQACAAEMRQEDHVLQTSMNELQQVEQTLRESEEKFRCFFEQSHDGLLVVNEHGVIIEWNQGAEDIFGLKRADVVGRSRYDALFDIASTCQPTAETSDQERIPLLDLLNLHTINREAPGSRFRQHITRPDGTQRSIASHLFPIQTTRRLLIGGIARDMTDTRQTEERLHQSQQLLKRTFSSLRDAVFTIDADTRIITCNPAAAAMFGYTWYEIVDQPIAQLLTNINAWNQLIKHLFRAIQEPGYLFLPECQMRRKDGTTFFTEHSVMPLPDEQGRYVGWVSVVRDISERKYAAQQLCQTNEQLMQRVDELKQHNREITLLNEMANLLQRCCTVDDAYKIIAWVAPKIFVGHSGRLSIHNHTTGMLESVAHWGNPDLAETTFQALCCCAAQQKKTRVRTSSQQCRCCCSGVPNQPISSMCIPLIEQGAILGVLYLYDGPVTDEQIYQRWQKLAETIAGHLALALINLRLREQLHYQAIRDPLTGLFNRRYLDETLKRELQRASRCQHPISIIMLDIDHFKYFNDTYGHDAGDAVLRAMGSLLQASIREDDIACRYGGEEFVLVLPGASSHDAYQRAEHLRNKVKALNLQHNEQPLQNITISLGVACFPYHGTTDDTVIKAADIALYRAKSEGRDKVVVATR